ncbi:MAG: DUF4402 domain-containing protein [Alphaproteobacteria bacterium]|nr:DUF4402 domain-containing protein [Alphaproteobacteria bacterium]
MRKYFLLSAVALLSANTVIAAEQGEIANMQVTANVSVVSEVNCSALNFGDIYIRANNMPSSVTVEAYYDDASGYGRSRFDGDVTGVNHAQGGRCELLGMYEGYTLSYPDHITLTGGLGGPSDEPDSVNAYVSNIQVNKSGEHNYGDEDLGTNGRGDIVDVGGTLNIPENFSGGELTGTITFTIINESV